MPATEHDEPLAFERIVFFSDAVFVIAYGRVRCDGM